ncbi:hypothetical protein GUJ93_ZPchr0007g5416 [Zizania palustris]|uniref:Uncharacterized protein n=1 Tax=Zizania palustris TaxID=103762 RepID=A0A8J5T6C9_ZIZPA|nr:hypothetical protein GUJ93_ZPchr0007g5416 [Zizania palustris]
MGDVTTTGRARHWPVAARWAQERRWSTCRDLIGSGSGLFGSGPWALEWGRGTWKGCVDCVHAGRWSSTPARSAAPPVPVWSRRCRWAMGRVAWTRFTDRDMDCWVNSSALNLLNPQPSHTAAAPQLSHAAAPQPSPSPSHTTTAGLPTPPPLPPPSAAPWNALPPPVPCPLLRRLRRRRRPSVGSTATALYRIDRRPLTRRRTLAPDESVAPPCPSHARSTTAAPPPDPPPPPSLYRIRRRRRPSADSRP